jgi:FAD:protein FMN transferase
MGSPCRLVFFEDDETKAGELLNQCLSELSRLEAKYSRYRVDSLLTAINRQGLQGITVDDETKGLLDYAHTAFIESNGLFDITSGLFRTIWNFKEQKIPTPLEIETIRQKVGWQHVTWKSARLQFQKEGMEIDLGGVVKEYAADRLYDLLYIQGIRHGLIDLGGDIRVIGPHPDGRPWNIGISDPLQPTSARMTLQLTTGAITTSGQYQRGFTYKNRRPPHSS